MRRDNPWKRLDSKQIYENAWVRVREDQVIRPDGRPGIYGVVEIPASVAIVALDGDGRLPLVGQWRYTRDRFAWEVPLGSSRSGEDMQAVAYRELWEETGVQARSWQALAQLDVGVGVTTDVAHVFLATDLEIGQPKPDPEERIEVRWVTLDEAVEEVFRGKIREANSVTAILTVAMLRQR